MVGGSHGLKPAARACARRRGSVLILVMVLLGVLFVTGVAFLASMDFESEMIAVRQERDVRETGINAVRQRVESILREGMTAGPTSSSGGSLDEPFLQAVDPVRRDPDASPIALGELPGVHNFAAPIEPYRLVNPSDPSDVAFVWPWITDLRGLNSSPRFSGTLKSSSSTLDARWPSARPPFVDFYQEVDLNGDGTIDPGTEQEVNLPVDADGDGVVDALQFDLRTLGFPQSRIDSLAAMVNPASNPNGRVYMGLRVVSHGGMVNLNEAHQLLIANVLDLKSTNAAGQSFVDVGLLYSAGKDKDLNGFRHSPTLRDANTRERASYSPQSEEAQLRRRGGLVPPRVVSPSLLQGNALMDANASPTGLADIPWLLPPVRGAKQETFGSVFDSPVPQHRHTPFTFFEPFSGGDPDGGTSLWAVRMTPFEGFVAGLSGVAERGFYDRRHLLTTVSHDDLLSRGGRVEELGVDTSVTPPVVRSFETPRSADLRGRMIEVNETAFDPDICPGDVASADGVPLYNDDVLPFEYADYPQTTANDGCACPTDPNCRRDRRKGRLALSLSWLDENLWCETLTDPARKRVCMIRRQRLIHDAFYMLVRNAKGPYWEDIDCTANPGVCVATGEVCLEVVGKVCMVGSTPVPCRTCHDPVTGQSHRDALIARTAASLTANMIDFVDTDDIPTRVAIRSFDFRKVGVCDGAGARACATDGDCRSGGRCIQVRTCDGGLNHGRVCTSSGECVDGTCVSGARTLGREINLATAADRSAGKFQFQYVYGLERQPYITEVATAVKKATPDGASSWGVELLNPSDIALGGNTDGDGWNDFWLVVGKGGTKPDVGTTGISLTPTLDILPGQFGVYLNDAGNAFGLSGGLGIRGAQVHDLTGADAGNIVFDNGDTVYLVRRYQYPTDTLPTDIVVDQFAVRGNRIAMPFNVVDCLPVPPPDVAVVSMERAVPQASPWKAPVPFLRLDSGLEVDHCDSSLAKWNADDPSVLPVEVNFANTGRFTLDDPDTENANGSPFYDGAFPTTGSMLLLMRHANRSLGDYRPAGDPKGQMTDLAFTTWLDDVTTFNFFIESSPGSSLRVPRQVTIKESGMIDNGRMPIFDPGVPEQNAGVGRQYAQHYTPGFDPQVNDPALPDPKKLDPNDTRNRPGRLMHLPWGQLLFDYFTVLPLSSLGPYAASPDKDEPIDLNAPPRVDMTGLRVHGRIDINAAPWKVLAGLPMVPAWRLPTAFRGKIGAFAGLDMTPSPPPGADKPMPRPIGDRLAQAIVAYRDVREVVPRTMQNPLPDPPVDENRTGDYVSCEEFDAFGSRCISGGRGWISPSPRFRRGTGFLSVGELANVRSLNSGSAAFRIDGGEIGGGNADFVKAAAKLIALADWVTVRSHVFTVYGTLRGDVDPDPAKAKLTPEDLAAGVDRRAIRFQETLDRLPTLLGKQSPQPIGRPVVAKFIDTRDD